MLELHMDFIKSNISCAMHWIFPKYSRQIGREEHGKQLTVVTNMENLH